MRKLILALLFVGLGLLPGCQIDLPDHDAGSAAFAHQIVQTLLCRKPRSTTEVHVIEELSDTYGRDWVAVALMETPEFYDCWTQIIMDHMQIQRNGQYAQLQSCVNEPTFLLDDHDANPATPPIPCSDSDPAGPCMAKATALADHIRTNRPRDILADVDGDGVNDQWNMHDAVRAALLVDDLHIAWRPWLIALAARPTLNGASQSEVRDNFMMSAFDVNGECLSCHTDAYSVTEVYGAPGSGWDRTASYGLDLRGGLYWTGNTVDSALDPTGLYATKCGTAGCHGPDGTNWPSGHPKPNTTRIPVMSRDAIVDQIVKGGGAMPAINLDNDPGPGDPGDIALARDLADFLKERLGNQEDVGAFVHAGQFAAAGTADPLFANTSGPFGMSPTSCGFQWRHDSANTTPSVYLGAVGNRMYTFGGNATTQPDVGEIVQALRLGVDAGSPSGEWAETTDPADPNVPVPTVQEASVAVLLANNIANDLLEELSGNRAVIDHGLSRTPEQAELLRWIAALMVVDNGTHLTLSLQMGLGLMVTSEFYNRRAPNDPIQPVGVNPPANSAYQLGMYLNPWAATADGIATAEGDNLNGQGDLVSRRSPNQVVWSLHHDLGWPAPKPFAASNSTAFPTPKWMAQLGRYVSTRNPGTSLWQFDSMVMYENQVGVCSKPAGVTTDFIDKLVDDARAAPAAQTIETVVLGLKDRLLQEPFFDPGTFGGQTERTLVQTLFNGIVGPAALLTPIKLANENKVKTAMRVYCGVLVMSPDYLMAGLPRVLSIPQMNGVFTTCLPGEPCTQTQIEEHYECYLGRVGAIVPAPPCP